MSTLEEKESTFIVDFLLLILVLDATDPIDIVSKLDFRRIPVVFVLFGVYVEGIDLEEDGGGAASTLFVNGSGGGGGAVIPKNGKNGVPRVSLEPKLEEKEFTFIVLNINCLCAGDNELKSKSDCDVAAVFIDLLL